MKSLKEKTRVTEDKKEEIKKIEKKKRILRIKENKEEKGEKQTSKKIIVETKKKKRNKRQMAFEEKKAKLAVKNRQTKWAPVWVVLKKYGTGKKIHPASITAYKRSWRRTKLHIKPRKIRKWHMG